MSVVGKTSGERRTIVEGKLGSSFGELEACPEGIDLSPVLDNLLLFLREVEGRRD